MSVQKHHITKQIFDLTLPKNADGFEVHKRISRYFHETIQPELARLFDRLVGPEEVVRIDSIVIDLGNIPLEKLASQEVLFRLLHRLEEEIRINTYTLAGKTNVEKLTLSEDMCDRWLHFLQHGHLPWQNIQSESEWQTRVLEGLVMQTSALSQLTRLLKAYPGTLTRLVWQHPDSFLVALTEIYTGHRQTELSTVRKELFRCFQMLSEKKISDEEMNSTDKPLFSLKAAVAGEFRDFFWRHVLSIVVIENRLLPADELLRSFLVQWLLQNSQIEKPELLTPFIQRIDGSATQALLLDVIKELAEDAGHNGTANAEKPVLEIRDDSLKVPENPPTEETSGDNDPAVSGGQEKEDILYLQPQSGPTSDEVKEQEWYVNNAGVVLLHPFLSRLFERCDLTKDGVFKDDIACAQAAHLIHFLATGNTEPPEYELLFTRVLCDIPLGTPLPKDVGLSRSSLEEAEYLLEVVIQQWGALGEVSFQSLQDGFLKRPGKLSAKETGWLLQVEQNTLDILLDRLPWGLSMIRLPWMKELLYVEWR